MSDAQTIGEYLLQRLHEAGIRHVFGVPGDYILRFYQQLSESRIAHVGTTREDTAAFAADGYARCHGIGALAVTYGVGALSVVNAIAGAHAESSPIVVISGAPGVSEQRTDPLIHHRFGPFNFQREIFDRITCASVVLDDPMIAFRQIDRALDACQRHCRPVYIELPRDMVDVQGYPMPESTRADTAGHEECGTLQEAVGEACELLADARSPVILAGVELHRRGLQPTLMRLVDRAQLPVAATLTGKSVVGEHHPCYLGVYEGAMGSESTRQAVEQADVLLILGMTMNDIDLGIYSARLDPHRMIRASENEVVIRHHRYPGVALGDFAAALVDRLPARTPVEGLRPPRAEPIDFPNPGAAMTVARLIRRLNTFLTPQTTIVCDTGDCLFAAMDLLVHDSAAFLASAYYTTMGFAMPAALGAKMARPESRILVLVGDGAFQMTGTELSTIARMRQDTIVIVFNNAGYSTERYILDGPFNDIADWSFHRIGELSGPLRAYDAATEDALEDALMQAAADRDGPSLINVRLRPDDPSPAMRRLGEHLRLQIDRQYH
jgi:indolepyruvate decarboxylase